MDGRAEQGQVRRRRREQAESHVFGHMILTAFSRKLMLQGVQVCSIPKKDTPRNRG